MTSFDPLFNASLAVQLHVAGALPALALTPVVLWRRQRDRLHKLAGYAWVAAMALTAISSFWITGFGVVGPFSPIHLLSVAILVGLVSGVRAALRGEHDGHRHAMTNMAWGLAGAGLLNFLPGRMANRILLGDAGWDAFAALVILVGMAGALGWVLLRRRGANQRSA